MRTCPITGLELDYAGRGRPPMFHVTATAKQRADYRRAQAGMPAKVPAKRGRKPKQPDANAAA